MTFIGLTPLVRDYAWGSHTALAQLSGRPFPTKAPEAEMWFGAHEDSPCPTSVGGRTLDRLIVDDPVVMLGELAVSQFQRRLPFLLKLLAPERALSIQCHPSREQALTAPRGTYGDTWPKPEALYTLTEFEIFAGLLPVDAIRDVAGRLGCPQFSCEVDATIDDGPAALLERLLNLPEPHRSGLTDAVVAACERHRDDDHFDNHFDAVRRAAEQYPGDPGVVVLLLMEHHIVPAERYMFVPAGVLHAYMRGTGVEILANSDNVVRAGLTPKKVDIAELLRIVDVHRTVVAEPVDTDRRVLSFPVDTQYFQLHRIGPCADEVVVPGVHKPRILLCVNGVVELSGGSEISGLSSGQACFVPANAADVHVRGTGTTFVATTGLAG